jgi:recombination protein RecA
MQNQPTKDRVRALEAAVEGLGRRFGKGVVMTMGDRPVTETEVIPSGSITLDKLLGIGGFPKGRVVEIFGPESSGKTTLALHAVAQAQAAGGTAAFVDAEHALDVTYAAKLGVDLDQLLISQPDSGEQALEVTEALVRSGAVDIIVIDSVAALVPQAELEGQMGDAHMGLQARLMSQALRKLTAITNRTGAIVIFLNQVRQKIGVVFGNGEVTPGGNALKFYASIRIEIRRIGTIKQGGESIGNRTRLKIVKNKMAPPFRQAEVEIMYGRGVCRAGEALTLGEEAGLVSKNGSWWSLGEDRLGQGREKVRERLLTEPELMAEVLGRLTAPADQVIAEAK